MRWVAVFEDDASRADVRRDHEQAHLDYLATHADRIVIGGGLRPEPGAWYCGGLWVMEVADRAEAVRLVEDDPFFRHGLRASYRLFTWGKAPCFGTVSL